MHTSFFAAAALLLASVSTTALADTLVDNANGIQVDARGKLQRFNALVIGNDGRVVKLLAKGDVRPANIDSRIDAGGRTLLPGLIDAHGHVMSLGFGALQLDLTGTTSLGDLQQRLKAYAAANPQAKWILGRGWNQELWADKRFPTAADLDVVVGDRPVWLGRVDGHAAVANSAALTAAGITARTAAPAGGRIENGLFVDAAMELVEGKIPAPDAASYDAALAKAQALMLASGLTAAADMGTSPADWAAMNRAGQAGRLNVRVLGYAGGIPAMRAINGGRPSEWLHDGRLHLGGVKLYADGALGSRGAWLKAPYHDMPSTRGLSLINDAELMKQASEASANGHQLAIHAIGDAANAQVITAFEQLGRRDKRDRRWRLEHAQVLDVADLPRLAKANIIASMQPTHQTSDRTMAEARLGPNRLGGAYAWQTIARSGARLAFGSDFPVESPNPFPGLAAAVSRQDIEGQPAGGWRPQERVSFAAALAGFTRGAAYASFAEDRIGSLDAGKHADFILVDRDISTVDPQALARTQVLETWVGGTKVWQRGASGGPGERGR
ncbi:MAG: amidohydrolase family protein [Pseudomonadota bacterium]|nr:amidohydrolase family protein [Pseudomonadota bacterium]